MTQIYRFEQLDEGQLQQIARQIEEGALAAFPTDTVYGLGTNAYDEKAIARIYALKQRPANAALQILVGSIDQARQIVVWNEQAQCLAGVYWPGALTIILPPNEKGNPLRRGFAGLGLRVPGHPGLKRLLTALAVPMACSSANLHGQPVITREQDLQYAFDGQVDILILGGELSPVASSVVQITDQVDVLREGAISREQLMDVLKQARK